MLVPLCALLSCGVDTTPGPLPATEQAEYSETEALSCTSMNGRAYAITFSNSAPATDTLVFVQDLVEAHGHVAAGFTAAPFTCTDQQPLLVTAEMPGDTLNYLKWSVNVSADAIEGTVHVVQGDSLRGTPAQFTGKAIAGTNATLRTPQREVKSY